MTAHRLPDITPLADSEFGFGLWPWAEGPLWRLDEPWTFRVQCPTTNRHWTFKIPSGYLFDKASIPSLFWGFPFGWTPDGLCTLPALEHDFLCDLLTGGSPWLKAALGGKLPNAPPPEVVHQHFETRLHEEGVRPFKATLMGLAVKAFGPQGTLRLFS